MVQVRSATLAGTRPVSRASADPPPPPPEQDKLIGKPVLRLRGSVPAANSVRFPTYAPLHPRPAPCA